MTAVDGSHAGRITLSSMGGATSASLGVGSRVVRGRGRRMGTVQVAGRQVRRAQQLTRGSARPTPARGAPSPTSGAASGSCSSDPGSGSGRSWPGWRSGADGDVPMSPNVTPSLSRHDASPTSHQPLSLVRQRARGGRGVLHRDLPELLDRPPDPLHRRRTGRARHGDGRRVHPRRHDASAASTAARSSPSARPSRSRSTARTRPRSTTTGTACSPTAARSRSAAGSRTGSGCPGRSCRRRRTTCSPTRDPARARAATEAMFKQRKIVLAELEAAADAASA